jgi:hypothetical protein
MMDWKQAIEEERAALMRLVALLVALAGLAELAAGRSPVVRCFVLWILRRAETAAREFVGAGERVASMPVGPAGSRPADAMRLAASLRALARQLERQLKRQARLISAACSEHGERGAETQPPLFTRTPAMRDLATALSMLAAFTWPGPCLAPDTS